MYGNINLIMMFLCRSCSVSVNLNQGATQQKTPPYCVTTEVFVRLFDYFNSLYFFINNCNISIVCIVPYFMSFLYFLFIFRRSNSLFNLFALHTFQKFLCATVQISGTVTVYRGNVYPET